MVVATVPLLIEYLLARDRQQRAHVLAKELHPVEVRIVPVALGNVEEVKKRVVLGVGVTCPDGDTHEVLLLEVLTASEGAEVLAQVRLGHLVDTLLLELVLHTPRLP